MIYTDIKIEKFRGIRVCELEKLGLVNLFFGKNNCGKSSLLEALFLMSGPSNPTLPIVLNNMRNLMSFNEEDLKADFYLANSENIIHLQSKGEQARDIRISMIESHSKQVALDQLNQMNSEQAGKRYGFKINFNIGENGGQHHTELIVTDENTGKASTDTSYKESMYAEYIPSGYMNVGINDKLAQIIKNKQESEILEALRIVEPKIKDIQLVGQKIMVDIGLPTRLPVNVLGDGVRKVLSILISIYNTQNGVLMVDEIDNGLHYSVMYKLWDVILQTCKKTNTQMFISTHSMDMVKALVASFKQTTHTNPQVSAYKLIKKEDDELVALRYSEEQLSYTVEQEIEIR